MATGCDASKNASEYQFLETARGKSALVLGSCLRVPLWYLVSHCKDGILDLMGHYPDPAGTSCVLKPGASLFSKRRKDEDFLVWRYAGISFLLFLFTREYWKLGTLVSFCLMYQYSS